MKNEISGQGIVEYIILVAMIAVVSLGIVKILGGTVNRKLTQITASLQGKKENPQRYQPPKIEEKHWKERSMDDFYESSEE